MSLDPVKGGAQCPLPHYVKLIYFFFIVIFSVNRFLLYSLALEVKPTRRDVSSFALFYFWVPHSLQSMELLRVYGSVVGLPGLLLSPAVTGQMLRHSSRVQNNLTSSPDNPGGTHVSCETTLYIRSEAVWQRGLMPHFFIR